MEGVTPSLPGVTCSASSGWGQSAGAGAGAGLEQACCANLTWRPASPRPPASAPLTHIEHSEGVPGPAADDGELEEHVMAWARLGCLRAMSRHSAT